MKFHRFVTGIAKCRCVVLLPYDALCSSVHLQGHPWHAYVELKTPDIGSITSCSSGTALQSKCPSIPRQAMICHGLLCSLCSRLMHPHQIPHYFCERDDCPSKFSRVITGEPSTS